MFSYRDTATSRSQRIPSLPDTVWLLTKAHERHDTLGEYRIQGFHRAGDPYGRSHASTGTTGKPCETYTRIGGPQGGRPVNPATNRRPTVVRSGWPLRSNSSVWTISRMVPPQLTNWHQARPSRTDRTQDHEQPDQTYRTNRLRIPQLRQLPD